MSGLAEPPLEKAPARNSGFAAGDARLSKTARRAAKPRVIARRRRALKLVKAILPLAALLLLSTIALWPELSRLVSVEHANLKQLAAIQRGAGTMLSPRYRGVDARGRPYMVTATTAKQIGPERIDLVAPRGDVTLKNGTWLLVQAKTGVYIQHADQLDLAGDVWLYRQDGTTMTSALSTIDMKKGVAISDVYTYAEGPFGTLDAEGYTLTDKGSVIQFHGPAKLVLNSAK